MTAVAVHEPPTLCLHEAVEASSLAPDPGGQMHEFGSCTGCGAPVVRSSPLEGWTPANDAE